VQNNFQWFIYIDYNYIIAPINSALEILESIKLYAPTALPPVEEPPVDLVLLVFWGVVTLSSLGTLATNWPVVPAPEARGSVVG
jgi:hypothetical protein